MALKVWALVLTLDIINYGIYIVEWPLFSTVVEKALINSKAMQSKHTEIFFFNLRTLTGLNSEPANSFHVMTCHKMLT